MATSGDAGYPVEKRPSRLDGELMDEANREIERRLSASGARSDEAAFLVSRVRAGALSPESLQLLACFHPAAALVTKSEVPSEFEAWAEGLESALKAGPQGAEEMLRVALVTSFLDRVRGAPGASEIASFVAALKESVVCPCPRHQREFEQLRERYHPAISMQQGSLKAGAVLLRMVDSHPTWTELLALGSLKEINGVLSREFAPWLLG